MEWTCNGGDKVSGEEKQRLVTDLCVCLTHPLVESLVVMNVLLQHADLVTHSLDLAAGGPVGHVADVLQQVIKLIN